MARKRRRTAGRVIAGVIVLLLVVAYFIVDAGLRAYAEDRVEKEVSDALPASVTGDVAVSIGGLSVIAQYLSGRFDRIDLDAPRLSAGGVVAPVHIVATGVPVDTSKPVEGIHGTVDLDQATVNSLVQKAGGPGVTADTTLELGADDVAYTGTLNLFGVPIGYRATATPTPGAGGDSIVFTPTGAQLTTGGGALDVSGIVESTLAERPITTCVATFLPEGVDVTGVNVTPERVRLTLESSTMKLNKAALTSRGACAGG